MQMTLKAIIKQYEAEQKQQNESLLSYASSVFAGKSAAESLATITTQVCVRLCNLEAARQQLGRIFSNLDLPRILAEAAESEAAPASASASAAAMIAPPPVPSDAPDRGTPGPAPSAAAAAAAAAPAPGADATAQSAAKMPEAEHRFVSWFTSARFRAYFARPMHQMSQAKLSVESVGDTIGAAGTSEAAAPPPPPSASVEREGERDAPVSVSAASATAAAPTGLSPGAPAKPSDETGEPRVIRVMHATAEMIETGLFAMTQRLLVQHRPFALKILSKLVADEPSMLKRLFRDAKHADSAPTFEEINSIIAPLQQHLAASLRDFQAHLVRRRAPWPRSERGSILTVLGASTAMCST